MVRIPMHMDVQVSREHKEVRNDLSLHYLLIIALDRPTKLITFCPVSVNT